MTNNKTPLAHWIDNHIKAAGGDVHKGLDRMMDEMKEAAEQYREEEAGAQDYAPVGIPTPKGSALIRADSASNRAADEGKCAHSVLTDSQTPVNTRDSGRVSDCLSDAEGCAS